MLLSLEACHRLPQIIAVVQKHLCQARNGWIIYTQSSLWEGPDAGQTELRDFALWIYPDKIQTTARHAPTIERLLRPRMHPARIPG
jgi:hypothetical protein